MSNVFISSVVSGFEDFRAAAGRAVELLGHTPVMCETFGARAYSSEIACIAEVRQSDLFVLILGQRYGYVPEVETISVVHAEYRAAKESGRPILAFIQDVEMELPQEKFKNEVQAYRSGEFRQKFCSPDELKDGVVHAISAWERGNQAMPQDEFEARVDEVYRELSGLGHGSDCCVGICFLPQPSIFSDLSRVESELDGTFQMLCSAGLSSLRDGYEPQGDHNWAGLSSRKLQYSVYENGMRVLTVAPNDDRDSSWHSFFLPPSLIRNAVTGMSSLLPMSSGFFSIRLMKIGNVFVAENPGGSSLQMRGFGGDDEYRISTFFNPLSRGALDSWLDKTMKTIERRFAYSPRSR